MSKFSLVRSGIIGDVRCSVLAGARLRISDFMASPSDHHPRRGVIGGGAAGLELVASLGNTLRKRGLAEIGFIEPNRRHLCNHTHL
jgi:hypothetical protein